MKRLTAPPAVAARVSSSPSRDSAYALSASTASRPSGTRQARVIRQSWRVSSIGHFNKQTVKTGKDLTLTSGTNGAVSSLSRSLSQSIELNQGCCWMSNNWSSGVRHPIRLKGSRSMNYERRNVGSMSTSIYYGCVPVGEHWFHQRSGVSSWGIEGGPS